MAILSTLFSILLIIVVIIGALALALALFGGKPGDDPDEKMSAHRLQYGETHRAYMVLPTPPIYADGWPDQMTSCQVVFIRNKNVPDRDQRLKKLGARLLTFEAAENASKDEKIIANVFKSEIGYHSPLRLPERISDGVEAYTLAVKMTKQTWPADWSPQPFFDIKVVFDGPQVGAVRANHIIPEKYRDAG